MKIDISIVVAMGNNLVIGDNGGLPTWRLRDDMKHFRDLTIGSAVVMGRKTFESFPEQYRPLPQRNNFIITRQKGYIPSPTTPRTFVCESLLSGLNRAAEMHSQKIFIIGGGEIYKASIDLQIVRTLIITEIDGSFDGDVFFPPVNLFQWNRQVLATHQKNERNSHSFSIVQYTK